MPASAVRSTRRVYPTVRGTVRCVEAPIAPCELLPEGQAGQVLINKAVYSLAYVATRAEGQAARIDGSAMRKVGARDTYEIPADLTRCECLDSLARDRADGLCKHRKALLALRAAGKIA